MTDDLLKRATGALRDETAQPELRSGLTRARMLDDAAKAQKKRRSPLRWVVPFVLTLGAGTALAHVTHQYFPAVWNAVVPEALERSVPEEEVVRLAPKPAKKKPALEAPAPLTAPEPVVTVAPAPEAVATVTPEPAPKPQRAQRTQAPVAARAPARIETPVLAVTPKPEAPAESAELALFRRAQQLHTAKDEGAIAAWDDFLRVAPSSPLATEARYNRALGLIRAGRAGDARKALAPFARGDMGGYRQREAAELIDALNERDGGVRER